MTSLETNELVDAALERLAGTGPQYGPGFTNHGPMVVDALVALERPEAVLPFVERYRAQLEDGPEPGRAPAGEEWQSALGDLGRYADLWALFTRLIDEQPVADVVADWVPRLSPGTVAAAFHGPIRTAHALRLLGRGETARTRDELARALAYWAATYQELPGPPLAIGQLPLPLAVIELPYFDEDVAEELNISDQVRHLDQLADEFEQAVASLAAPATPESGLAELAVAGAYAYLGNAERSSDIALVHTVTGPAAVALVLPWLRAVDRPAAFDYTWQAAAALHVAYTLDRNLPGSADADTADHDASGGSAGGHGAASLDPTERQEMIDRAVASGSEHAIKLTEACLRVYETVAEPVLLDAAADAGVRLGG